jgi:predicted Zn-dependent protease
VYRNWLFIISFLFYGVSIYAHGDLHKRILKVTEEISISPDSAFLYFKRGKLNYQHSNYISSLKDLKNSKKLGLNSIELKFLIARNYYHLKKFNDCKKSIKEILKEKPGEINSLKLLAALYFKKEKFKKSAQLYDEVIKNSQITYPEHYLYASKAWYASNTRYGIKRSQSVLKEGIEKIGDIVLLYNELISNYLDLQDFDSAEKYQEKVIDISNRKERAYLRLANIQIQQEKFKAAELSILKAEESYIKLPYRLRNAIFMREFYSELQKKK